MIRRAYCIVCGYLHRRDPQTWTDRACCKCGAEVRFSSPPERYTLGFTIRVRREDIDLLGPRPHSELARVLRAHFDKLRRRALKGARCWPPPTVGLSLEVTAPDAIAERFRDDEPTDAP